ncbi:MAG: trypsin-like serine protease [Chthoniobacteraceae bacterium]
MLSLVAILPARAILIDNTWNLAASNALARDFANFPSFAATGEVGITEGVGAATTSFTGTGVLIANDWVLTAAHNWTDNAVTALTFTVGGTLYTGNLAQRFQHPLWNMAPAPPNATVGISQGWDIALFRLTAPVAGITPAQIYTGSNELNSQVYTLGFGRTGNGSTPTGTVTGTLHAISNTIDRATSQTSGGFSGGQLFYDFDNGATLGNTLATAGLPDNGAFNTTLATAGTIFGTTSATTQVSNGAIIEGGTAQGDSGGPTFILDGGAYKVAGITSWGINPATDYGTTGLYGDVTAVTRVSENSAWINSVLVPEPATGIMMMLAGMILGIVLRRRPSGRWPQFAPVE